MTKLEALSKAASTGATKVREWRSRMERMVSSMTEKLIAIQSKINTIKDQGNTAKKACQDLIKANYEPQQEAIRGILENIKTMTNIEEVNKLILDMSSTVGRVKKEIGIVDGADAKKADAAAADPDAAAAAADPDAAAAAAAAAGAAAATDAKKGGYTFGRSKRRGKKRRKRTKKSRKKGSNKK